MSKAASTIEINGNRYDAKTGDVIGSVKRFARQVKNQSGVIDGFVRRPIQRAPLHYHIKKPSAKAVHQTQQRSHTLMRDAVNKPLAKKSTEAKTEPKSTPAETPLSARAKTIVKNAQVRRFGVMPSSSDRQTEVLTAKKTSAHAATAAHSSIAAPTLPGLVGSVSHQRLERMLDEALVRADAHKNMLRDYRRSKNPLRWVVRHWLILGIVAVVLLIAAGIFIWRTVPAVSMKVAARQAGVSASLPSYTPTGYKVVAPVSYSNNAVTVNYANQATPEQTYSLSERKSTWDSASLAANAIGKNVPTQTSEIGGTTVYVYGSDNNATWVNNGTWYTLSNNAGLTSDQLLNVAQNM